MAQNTQMIYSTHARWYVSIPTAVDRKGRIRRALVVSSPHYDTPHFVELKRRRERSELLAEAGRLVDFLFWAEDWFRRPRQIRCDSIELTAVLSTLLQDHAHVRTDARARKFVAAAAEFRDHVMSEGFSTTAAKR